MTRYFITLVVSISLLSISCKKDGDEKDGADIRTLIVGKWKSVSISCNAGYEFRADGTWSFKDFDGCGNLCGALPYGGTYEIINGNIIQSTGGPAVGDNLNGRVEMVNGVFTLYDRDTGNLIDRFSKSAC